LDTDWYASTLTKLEVLLPLLSPRGVLIVDDYGYWSGSRRAVEEYFQRHAVTLLLHRIDSIGRIGVCI
ncbi:MAG: TylF/MycF/NovP-related O-methyltransferase, partial [Candidatus Methanomethyliaceae archaeon]